MRYARLGPLAVAAVVLGSGCSSPDGEAGVRAVLEAAEAAAESRDTGFFRDFVGDGYRDSRGHDRAELLRLLQGYFLANQRVEVVSRIEEIQLDGAGAAKAVVHAALVGQQAGASLLGGIGGDFYRFEIELIDDGGEWRMIGATWERGARE